MGAADRYYDRHLRDPRSKEFYNSAAWQRCRANKLARAPWCERCGAAAAHVHHLKEISTADGWEKRLDAAGLESLCIPCHNAVRAGDTPAVPAVSGIFQPREDDTFVFDADAGERPIRFIQKFCRHFEAKWAGARVELLDWQKQIIRTLYGWKRRDDGRRRFSELFLLSAKGAGKTPFLSAIGKYELYAGGEHAAHVVSLATDFAQAQLTQDWARRSIVQDAQLSKLSQITRFEIRVPRTAAKWTTLSGTFAGRAGFRPSCVLADEAWEWPNDKLYRSVTANLFKREQPLLLISTNAGESRDCFCWSLYETAKAVLAGVSDRTDLLPAIFEAPEAMDWTSEAAARAACPSIPAVISFDALEPKIVAARKSPHLEAEYRRLHLSQWRRNGAKRWLDMEAWDAAIAAGQAQGSEDAKPPKDAPLYIGVDLSEGDDLCSAVFVTVTAEKFWVENLNWLPRETAEHYAAKGIARYDQWEADGDITLLDERTIGAAARQRIADDILAHVAGRRVRKFCYDPYRADEVVAAMTAAGLVCEPIRQGFGVSSGCAALERRLKDASIVLPANRVMRAAAENVEVKQDARGNIWPVKPGAKDRYAGTRSIKIDPIAALVTALVEARKHAFAVTEKKWNGGVWVV